MRIALLAGLSTIHTVRWANALVDRGHEVHLFTMHHHAGYLQSAAQVHVHVLPFPPKVGYYMNIPMLRWRLRKVKPDVLNAHYASGYGTLARHTCFHPWILSVWGSDVYDFPRQSSRNHTLVGRNLLAADHVCSTSVVMARQVKKNYPLVKDISITPFGVDGNLFTPGDEFREENVLTIGTVKSFTPKYGIDTLILAFAKLRRDLGAAGSPLASMLRLMLVGDGPIRENLAKLVKEEGVDKVTWFPGAVSHRDIPGFLKKMDIYVALSRLDSESFGVAIVEASSCGIPVLVSDVDGLGEVVRHGQTGLIVPRDNVDAATEALATLVQDRELRRKYGENGRQLVLDEYEWNNSVRKMEDIYGKVYNIYNGQ